MSENADHFEHATDSPLGPVRIAVNDSGSVVAVSFGDAGEGGEGDPRCVPALLQLQEYFRGERRDFEVELDPSGTDFELQVWAELRRIPYGATTTYGEIARRIGDPDASRAVGVANARNPIAILVPCHRVIGSDGDLTGYAGGLDRKKWLLDHESGQERLF
jgi:methylated-DNA-[protein]-cysteine S-methyltransferase